MCHTVKLYSHLIISKRFNTFSPKTKNIIFSFPREWILDFLEMME